MSASLSLYIVLFCINWLFSSVCAFQHVPKLYSRSLTIHPIATDKCHRPQPASAQRWMQTEGHSSPRCNKYSRKSLHCSRLYLAPNPTIQSTTTVASQPLTTETVLKAVAIVALILQNSGLALAMRLSRTKSSSVAYITSTAVVLSETLKFFISWFIHLYQQQHSSVDDNKSYLAGNGGHSVSLQDMVKDVEGLTAVAIPSALYVFQNNLQYIAMSSLPAAIYQVLVQMKLITAALLSKWYLKKDISVMQWISILVLTFGVAIVQSSIHSGGGKGVLPHINLALGLTAVGLSCVTSGFAGVQLEKTLKDGKSTLWVRNTQISLVSILFAAATCFFKDFNAIRKNGFFYGYNPLVWMVVLTHAIGGILVSLVVKQTSNIAKGFTTGASIILTSLVSALILKDVKLNWQFLIGTIVVCISTFTYSAVQPKRKSLN